MSPVKIYPLDSVLIAVIRFVSTAIGSPSACRSAPGRVRNERGRLNGLFCCLNLFQLVVPFFRFIVRLRSDGGKSLHAAIIVFANACIDRLLLFAYPCSVESVEG